jgi:hypothetical protein
MFQLLKRKTQELVTSTPNETPLQRYHRRIQELRDSCPTATEKERDAFYEAYTALRKEWEASPGYAEMLAENAKALAQRDSDHRIYNSMRPAPTTKFIEQPPIKKKAKRGSK